MSIPVRTRDALTRRYERCVTLSPCLFPVKSCGVVLPLQDTVSRKYIARAGNETGNKCGKSLALRAVLSVEY